MKNRYLKNVVTLMLDRDKCSGCGVCIDVCPHNVLALSERKVEIIDKDACMECGACANNCPVQAINVRAGVGCAAAMLRGGECGGGCECGGAC